MVAKLPDVVMVSSNDWDQLWYQRQEFTARFARAGHHAFYFNRTPQSWPTLAHVKERLLGAPAGSTQRNPRPDNLQVVTPLWLPPLSCCRFVNRRLIRRTLAPLDVAAPVLITGVPTYNSLDLMDLVSPSKVIYLNAHNYDGAAVLRHLYDAEKLLVQRADVLFATSLYNVERLQRISNGRTVHQAPPGVDYHAFHRALRGDEIERRRTLYYFGGIGAHMNLALYGALAKRLRVVLVGVVDPAARDQIPENVEVRPPVSNADLPKVLEDADMIGVFYHEDLYIRGVLPAKFFECLATGKPVLVCGLAEARAYERAVHVLDGSVEAAVAAIEGLPVSETPERRAERDHVAREADWPNRFERFRTLSGI